MRSASTARTMMLITYAVLLYLIQITSGKKCDLEGHVENNSWESQLHNYLLDNIEYSLPPKTNNSESLKVHLRFILRNFQFDSQEEVFSLYTWMFISWTDERLRWEPTSYGGLKTTEMTSLHIWVPIFRLFNSADVDDYDRFFYVHCKLKYTGDVLCIPRTMHKTTCGVNIRNWPYDRQKCSVIYGAWTNGNYCISLSFSSRAIKLLGAEYGAEWMIVDYEQIENQSSEQQLTMIFTVEREAQTLAALIIYPSYIIAALTFVTLWLDVRSILRLYLVCFSLFCHYYFISELGAYIPKHSVDTPTIILYYRALEILTVIDFLLTMYLRILCRKEFRPSNFIIAVTDFVYNSYCKFVMYPSWNIDDTFSDEKFNEDWTKFANVLNNVSMIIFFIVYICLYFVFMPQPHPNIV